MELGECCGTGLKTKQRPVAQYADGPSSLGRADRRLGAGVVASAAILVTTRSLLHWGRQVELAPSCDAQLDIEAMDTSQDPVTGISPAFKTGQISWGLDAPGGAARDGGRE